MSKKDNEIRNNLNQPLIDEFDLLVKHLDYQLSNNEIPKEEVRKFQFKVRHFKNAIKVIKYFPDKINSGKDLEGVKGIGKGIMDRIDEIINTKKLKEVDSPKIKKIKKHMDLVSELSEVINIGSKVAKQLIDTHNLKSLDELKKKVEKGDIEVNDKIKLGLKYHGIIKTKIPRKEMDEYNKKLLEIVSKLDSDLILTVAGSYRRMKKFSNDVDVLITHKNIKTNDEYSKIDKNYLDIFIKLLKSKKMIVDDLTDTDNGTKYMGFSKLPRKSVRRIDVRFVPYNYYHAALLYFTGSYELNTQMRQVAKTMGYKLNEYGLFKERKDGKYPKEPLKASSEKDIFKKLKLDYLEPIDRG